jgi:serine protease AprX
MHGEPTGIHSGTAAPPNTRTKRPWIWITAATTVALIIASVGTALILDGPDVPTSFLELYLTDLPADFSRFDVRIAAVEFGAQRLPLELDQRAFDLLSLRGPSDALRIARGTVPAGQEQDIHIRFESATLELDHKTIAVDIPDAQLTVGHDYGLTEGALRSVLFDIDVEDSLTIDGPSIRFEPVVQSVYIVAEGALGRSGAATPTQHAGESPADFTAAPPQEPKHQELKPVTHGGDPKNPFETISRTTTPSPTPTLTTTSAPTTTTPAQDDPDPEAEDDYLPTPGNAFADAPVDYADTMLGWFVQYFPDTSDLDTMKSDIEAAGAEIIYRFESLPALYIAGQEVYVANITRQAWADHVEPVVPVHLDLSSSKPAIRSPELTQALTEIRDAQGRIVDGRGIGVAVVDSGIDGLHPDLTHFLITGDGSPVRANFKVVSNNLVDMPNTDTTSGHGTHVAGIVAGRGTKDPSLKGVAPGATLYGFGIGELANTLWTNQAFDWIIQHGHKQNPPIKVVTNSWGTTGAYDPDSLTTRLVNQLVAKGVVVVFSAGNNGGDGNAATTSPECQIPTAGVLCVAWYDDQAGTRNGELADKSSRGSKILPATWPDISAPGSAVRSARTPFGWVTGVGLTDYYVTLEGTSMAAPHVAGAVALMMQARAGLSPAQVDAIVKSTAYKYADEGPYAASGSHYAKGHGLLDAYAAVQAAKTT